MLSSEFCSITGTSRSQMCRRRCAGGYSISLVHVHMNATVLCTAHSVFSYMQWTCCSMFLYFMNLYPTFPVSKLHKAAYSKMKHYQRQYSNIGQLPFCLLPVLKFPSWLLNWWMTDIVLKIEHSKGQEAFCLKRWWRRPCWMSRSLSIQKWLNGADLGRWSLSLFATNWTRNGGTACKVPVLYCCTGTPWSQACCSPCLIQGNLARRCHLPSWARCRLDGFGRPDLACGL